MENTPEMQRLLDMNRAAGEAAKAENERPDPVAKLGGVRCQASPIVGAEGMYPSRIVLWRDPDTANPQRSHSFVTHVECLPPDGQPYLLMGHYDMSYPEAVKDYGRRVRAL